MMMIPSLGHGIYYYPLSTNGRPRGLTGWMCRVVDGLSAWKGLSVSCLVTIGAILLFVAAVFRGISYLLHRLLRGRGSTIVKWYFYGNVVAYKWSSTSWGSYRWRRRRSMNNNINDVVVVVRKYWETDSVCFLDVRRSWIVRTRTAVSWWML